MEALDTVVLDYEVKPGTYRNFNSVQLHVTPKFDIDGLDDDSRRLAEYLNVMAEGSGSLEWGETLALIGNMIDTPEIISALNELGTYGHTDVMRETFNASIRTSRSLSGCDVETKTVRILEDNTCYWAQVSRFEYEGDPVGENPGIEYESSASLAGRVAAFTGGKEYAIMTGVETIALTNSDDFSANGKRYLGGAGYKDEIFGFENSINVIGGLSTFSTSKDIEVSGFLPNGVFVDETTSLLDQNILQFNTNLGTVFHQPIRRLNLDIRAGVSLDTTFIHGFGAVEKSATNGIDLAPTSQIFFSPIPMLEIEYGQQVRENVRVEGKLRGEAMATWPNRVFVNGRAHGSNYEDGQFRNYSPLDKTFNMLSIEGAIIDTDGTISLNFGYARGFGQNANTSNVEFGLEVKF